MVTNRQQVCDFYRFLIHCIGKDFDPVIVGSLPLMMQRDLVRAEWWIFSRGGEL